jgi:hypothetical protein
VKDEPVPEPVADGPDAADQICLALLPLERRYRPLMEGPARLLAYFQATALVQSALESIKASFDLDCPEGLRALADAKGSLSRIVREHLGDARSFVVSAKALADTSKVVELIQWGWRQSREVATCWRVDPRDLGRATPSERSRFDTVHHPSRVIRAEDREDALRDPLPRRPVVLGQ